jgi:hypothetical protein
VPYTAFEPLSKKITIVVGLTVVGFMAFGLVLSFYRNVLFEEHLRDINRQNEVLAETLVENRASLEYYHSAQFKDKYAKEHFSRLNPGEKVVIIALANDGVQHDVFGETAESQSERREAAFEDALRQIPVYLHWQLFLFDRVKLEELKNG